MDSKSVNRNVSMYPSDWELVERVAHETGVRGVSAALRIIIREWEAQQITIAEYEEQLKHKCCGGES